MGSRVLIVEDDALLVKAYEAKMTRSGLVVRIVNDGDEALEALQSFQPDLVLLDLIMPHKDGYAFLQEIKTMPAFQNLPIIVASNLGQKTDIDKVKALGVIDYIVKSEMSLDQLIERIKTVLASLGKS